MENILSDLKGEEKPKYKKRRLKLYTGKREKRRRTEHVKRECIDEVATTEVMNVVEKKLWIEHYNSLCEKFTEIINEKCTGCQTDEPNQLAHDICLLASSEEQANVCFEDAYTRVNWNTVMDRWYENILKMPVALNPEALILFRQTVNPEEQRYKNRMKNG